MSGHLYLVCWPCDLLLDKRKTTSTKSTFAQCLVKWLEVRCVCPMCNKPIAGPPEQHHSIGTLLDELV
ncbi:hypothetical protein AMECASPLE_022404 [Ameca splendens]|uniref:Uncharacterized protein n=1 Tax=Ameca splendens TaxID=208324 RepID=A0ABV0XSP9_9TELE